MKEEIYGNEHVKIYKSRTFATITASWKCSRSSLRIQHNSRVIINRLQRRPWAGFIAGLCIKQQSGNKLTAMIAEWGDKVVY